MKKIDIRKYFKRHPEMADVLQLMTQALNPNLSVWDASGVLLFGSPHEDLHHRAGARPILPDPEAHGWVSGGPYAQEIAMLLAQILLEEREKKSIVIETLDLLREINLLYNLSTKFANIMAGEIQQEAGYLASKVAPIGKLALSEALRRIHATTGVVALLDRVGKSPRLIDPVDDGLKPFTERPLLAEILSQTGQSGQAEIVNAVSGDYRFTGLTQGISSFLCAPLKANNQTTGIILLASHAPFDYSARDLKLLVALASQAGPALENARLHEIAIQKAGRREARLQAQLHEMKTELEKVKQKDALAEIIESEYYQYLRNRAEELRNLMG